jgi:hypothetical protein
MTADQVLSWVCLIAAVASVGVYFWLIATRVRMIRLMTNMALFLTGLALFQGPNLLIRTEGELSIRLAVLSLILAVGVQIIAAFRTRPSWSGVDRRSLPSE